MKFSARSIAPFVVAHAFLVTSVCGGQVGVDPREDINSESPAQIVDFVRGRFRSWKDIELLTAHDRHEVALFAAWELSKRIDHSVSPLTLRPTGTDNLPLLLKSMKTRSGMDFPAQWKMALVSGSGRNRFFSVPGRPPERRAFGALFAPKDVLFVPDSAGFVIGRNRKKIRLSSRNLYKLFGRIGNQWPRSLSILFHDQLCFVAFPPDVAIPFHVGCFSHTGKIQWVARVWSANLPIERRSGLGVHRIELAVSKNKLVIFGGNSRSIYVEAFGVETGKPVFRFNTSYWGLLKEPLKRRQSDLRLARAVKLRDVIGVRRLLEQGTNPNAEVDHAFGESLLQEAARSASPKRKIAGRKIAEMLIDHGAYYDILSAAALSDEVRVRSLIQHDSTLARCRDSWGFTAIHIAAENGDAAIVKILLDGGADVNAPTVSGIDSGLPMDDFLMPLHFAAEHNRIAVAKLLLAAGASATAKTFFEKTPLDYSSTYEMDKLLKEAR